MDKKDKVAIELIKNLINEVKQEIRNKKILTEEKTPQQVFKKHEQNIKEYVTKNIFEVINNSQKE